MSSNVNSKLWLPQFLKCRCIPSPIQMIKNNGPNELSKSLTVRQTRERERSLADNQTPNMSGIAVVQTRTTADPSSRVVEIANQESYDQSKSDMSWSLPPSLNTKGCTVAHTDFVSPPSQGSMGSNSTSMLLTELDKNPSYDKNIPRIIENFSRKNNYEDPDRHSNHHYSLVVSPITSAWGSKVTKLQRTRDDHRNDFTTCHIASLAAGGHYDGCTRAHKESSTSSVGGSSGSTTSHRRSRHIGHSTHSSVSSPEPRSESSHNSGPFRRGRRGRVSPASPNLTIRRHNSPSSSLQHLSGFGIGKWSDSVMNSLAFVGGTEEEAAAIARKKRREKWAAYVQGRKSNSRRLRQSRPAATNRRLGSSRMVTKAGQNSNQLDCLVSPLSNLFAGTFAGTGGVAGEMCSQDLFTGTAEHDPTEHTKLGTTRRPRDCRTILKTCSAEERCTICFNLITSLCAQCDGVIRTESPQRSFCRSVSGVCGHAFHQHCMNTWAERCITKNRETSCPLCNASWKQIRRRTMK